MNDRGVPRTGYTITKDDQQIGVVTSGTLSPSTGIGDWFGLCR